MRDAKLSANNVEGLLTSVQHPLAFQKHGLSAALRLDLYRRVHFMLALKRKSTTLMHTDCTCSTTTSSLWCAS